MSICLYKKHPPHNLGGENYPHFRSKTAKQAGVAINLIDTSKGIKLNITRLSFDTARIVLNVKKFFISLHPTEISGLLSEYGEDKKKYEYGFVVGGSFGSNKDVVILELKLDYGLTYGPLKFNKALVRVNRKHMRRFTKDSTKKKYIINFNQTNRQLQIPEKTTPPNILKLDKPDINPSLWLSGSPILMIGIVFTPIGSVESSPEGFKDGNYYVHLGENTPGNQNGFLIIAKGYEPNINSWLSLPGITQTFYFFMPIGHINVVEYDIIQPTGSLKFVGDYYLNDAPDSKGPHLDFSQELNVIEMKADSTTNVSNYKQIASFLVAITILSRNSNEKPKDYFSLNIDSNGKVSGNFKSYDEKNLQLLSIKSFITGGIASGGGYKSNQPIRFSTNIYFTTINIFNNYMNYHSKTGLSNRLYVDYPYDKPFTSSKINKTEKVNWLRKLKLGADFKILICFQNESQNIKLHLGNEHEGTYNYKWILTINNSYFIAEPVDKKLIPKNKKYNLIMINQSTLPNYTDGSLEFYQKQGVSYETGINQAKYMLNGSKRYNQFQEAKVPFEAVTGTINSAIGSFFTGTTIGQGIPTPRLGAVGAGFGAVKGAIAGGFNIAEMKLMNERREKQAYYALKTLQAKQEDIFNQPTTTHANDKIEASYQFISNKVMPYLVVMAPTDADLIAQAKLYHKFGNLNDQDEVVDLDNEGTRRCGNFGEIHNIEQAIVKDKLNYMVITFFNNLFNKGVRLGNVFYTDVVFNDYSPENGENKILEDEK